MKKISVWGWVELHFTTISYILSFNYSYRYEINLIQIMYTAILGDPGAVSRVGRKGTTKVFKYRWNSPWVPTLTELFPKIQADAVSWLGTKNALYYCAQSANRFSWVLFVSSYTRANVLPHLPGSFTKLVRVRETFIFYFPNNKWRNYRWVEKTFGCYQQEQFNLPREYSVFDLSQCIVNNSTFKMQRRRESQISNFLTRQNNNFAHASHIFVHFFAVNCTTTSENA